MPYMLYPEKRRVSDQEVLSWYADRMTDEEMREHPGRSDDYYQAVWKDHYHGADLRDAISYLEDLGVATFSDAFPRTPRGGF